jgi:hypothetical protein
MKVLSLGDIHGRNAWKSLTHGPASKFEDWKVAVEHGTDPTSVYFSDLPFYEYDLIVFIGDYFDSFRLSNSEILANVMDIIFFKRQLGDRVVLILGNHDTHYLLDNQRCSGYRPEMAHDARTILRHNQDLFTMAHERVGSDGLTYLWTHAGITSGWLSELKDQMAMPSYRFREIVEERSPKTVAEHVNLAWELNHPLIFAVDSDSDGIDEWAGPLWVRPGRLNRFQIDSHVQIVGHTAVDSIERVETSAGCCNYYIDCLEYGRLEGLTLEI